MFASLALIVRATAQSTADAYGQCEASSTCGTNDTRETLLADIRKAEVVVTLAQPRAAQDIPAPRITRTTSNASPVLLRPRP